MSFRVFADGSGNLTASLREGIEILPLEYRVDGVPHVYDGNLEAFDGGAYFDALANGCVVQTSLINTELFLSYFRPVLEQGEDVIYVAMGANISGTYNAARLAAEELMEDFPERFIHIVDSRGCGFGSGRLAVKAAKLAAEGKTGREAAVILDASVEHSCQYFTVDDLNFLKRTGRVTGMTAKIGTMLNIKPILYGTSDGYIESCDKVRGRKKSIDELAAIYRKKVVNAAEQTVCISHGNCIEDAEHLARLVREADPPKEIVIGYHEPFSGSHVGPGMLALFFTGSER